MVGEFIVAILKLVLFIVLFPLLCASVISFQDHLGTFANANQIGFYAGFTTFLITFIFIYQFWGVFELGQKIISGIFKILAPLDKILSSAVSFYLSFIVIVFFAVRRFLDIESYDQFFMFLMGFFFTMHIILTAQELKDNEKSPIKPSYLFYMSLIFIFNVFLLSSLLSILITDGEFLGFYGRLFNQAEDMYIFFLNKMSSLALGQ